LKYQEFWKLFQEFGPEKSQTRLINQAGNEIIIYYNATY